MSGFDANNVYTVSVHDLPAAISPESPSETEKLLYEFLLQYRVGGEFIYRDKLRGNLLLKQYFLEVDLRHISLFNDELAHIIQDKPAEVLPLFENAATKAARTILFPMVNSEDRPDAAAAADAIPKVQVTLRSGLNLLQFRELTADTMNKLVRIPGIVISASVLSSRATKLHLQCRACRSTKIIYPGGGMGGVGGGSDRGLPRVCDAPEPEGQKKDCPIDPYLIIHSKSMFADQQTLKLQEAPDMVPVGELPRHMLLSVDRYLTGKVVPGSRIIATGIYSTFQSAKNKSAGPAALRQPYLRVIHLEMSSPSAGGGSNPFGVQFTPEEEEEFGEMARSEGFYERFAKSVAPSIYGSLDIKKAIACLLFGGSKKVLPDGMRLRGDINVLLLGDPGTAKSQLLKFVEKVAPIAVYTSGKGSSAAGLTASVQRDAVSREFYLEGGAMVLADTGVVCIDEFDKMRDEDRVAIHEAMEQQTISIAKAGITTVLNSRTSVLAAANPVFGRYDEGRSPGENIDFQTTILSRFDMIFIVKDEHNEARDKMIAQHVMKIHMNRATASAEENGENVGELDLDKMKRYISYCKSKCAPRLSPDAQEMLSSHFVSLRKQVQQVERDNDERSSIPITVRQLEAIIRISESLAKMTLSTVVKNHHVEEAIRLFKFSTMDAVSAGSADGLSRGQLNEEMTRIERELRRRLPVGWSTSYQSLTREFVTQQGFSSHALERTLFIMEKREIIRFSGQQHGFNLFDSKHSNFYGIDFGTFHSPADLSTPSIDCFENELDQLDLLELEVTQVNSAFSHIPPTIGPPSSITQSSESSLHDTLSFYSEPFHSPQTDYSFSLNDMDFNSIVVEDYINDSPSFGPLPPTPPRSPHSRGSFSDYGPPKQRNPSISSSFYSQLAYTPALAQNTIAPSRISTPVVVPSSRDRELDHDEKGDPRKKYKCQNCPRAFARAYNLKTHMATHDPNRLKPHVCPHSSCGRSFSRKHDLGRHLVSIHRDDSDVASHHSTSSKVSIGVEKGPRGWCDTCGKGFVGKTPACACRDIK
ncbi:hypothetical protein C0991_008791 [Blastosporella zonata]|nr:hypothetical protein C0991_008791 [Blastosporella zonata]